MRWLPTHGDRREQDEEFREINFRHRRSFDSTVANNSQIEFLFLRKFFEILIRNDFVSGFEKAICFGTDYDPREKFSSFFPFEANGSAQQA